MGQIRMEVEFRSPTHWLHKIIWPHGYEAWCGTLSRHRTHDLLLESLAVIISAGIRILLSPSWAAGDSCLGGCCDAVASRVGVMHMSLLAVVVVGIELLRRGSKSWLENDSLLSSSRKSLTCQAMEGVTTPRVSEKPPLSYTTLSAHREWRYWWPDPWQNSTLFWVSFVQYTHLRIVTLVGTPSTGFKFSITERSTNCTSSLLLLLVGCWNNPALLTKIILRYIFFHYKLSVAFSLYSIYTLSTTFSLFNSIVYNTTSSLLCAEVCIYTLYYHFGSK